MQRVRYLLFPAILLTAITSAVGQSPRIVSITEIARGPGKFEGSLVTIKGCLVFGWEGDDFLFDCTAISGDGLPKPGKPRVWLYAELQNQRRVFGALERAGRPVSGEFTGYFHFVPSKESRLRDVFDPGPYQLQAIWAVELPQEKPPTRTR